MPKVYFASDHAGFVLKHILVSYVKELGYEAEDLGPTSENPDDDYPDFIIPAAQKVAGDPTAFAILMGKSGQGEAMAANRTPSVRAAVYYGGNLELVTLPREHENANVLSLAAGFVGETEAKEAVRVFLTTPFSNAPRHVRRLAKY